MTQNGVPVYLPVLDQQTLYASALVTINDKGYTKHYFEEGRRICSKIGSGELQDVDNLVDHMEMNYEEQRDRQQDGITKTYEQCINITPHIKNVNLHEYVIGHYRNPMNSSEPSFYYHSDHLGSASFLTDETGAETQQLVYLPYGEDWVDKKYNTGQYETPYKFNGKEKDQETGYNNYGARYYYDWASIWLSVDPMSDKYPHITSYNYCFNKPVMLTDPDGKDPLKRAFKYARKNNINEGTVNYHSNGKDVFLDWGSSSKSGVTINSKVFKETFFEKAGRWIDGIFQGKGSQSHQGGYMFSTKHFDRGAEGPGITVSVEDLDGNHMGVYTNVDDLLSALGGVSPAKTGKPTDIIGSAKYGIELGYESAGKAQDIRGDKDDSTREVNIRYRTSNGWYKNKSTILKDSSKAADDINKNGNTILK